MKVIIQNQIIDLSLVWRIGDITIDREHSHWYLDFTIYFLNNNKLLIHMPVGLYTSSSFSPNAKSQYSTNETKTVYTDLSIYDLNAKLEKEEPYLSALANFKRMRDELVTKWSGSESPYEIIS